MIPLTGSEKYTLGLLYRQRENFVANLGSGFHGLADRGLAYNNEGYACLTEAGFKLARALNGN